MSIRGYPIGSDRFRIAPTVPSVDGIAVTVEACRVLAARTQREDKTTQELWRQLQHEGSLLRHTLEPTMGAHWPSVTTA
jgi:hypothetical protein